MLVWACTENGKKKIDGKMRREKMEETLVEKGGRKKCTTERNARPS